MSRVRAGLGSSVLWILKRVFSALIVAGLGSAVLWLVLLGHAPPAPPGLPDAGLQSKTEVAAIGRFAGIGAARYGDCTRILSIDGGGVRGLVPALILAEIERRTGRPIYQQFNLIVGTSTGSILALGLTRPSNADARQPAFAAKDLVQLYRDHAQRIFPHSFAPLRYLRRIFRPKFSPQDIESLYETYFEDVQLQEALTNVAVPAYDVEESKRFWFQSYASDHADILMRDIVRGATAAPTYFPPARFAVNTRVSASGHVALVDGALFANNPAQDALLLAQKLQSEGADKSVLMLSIGTGRSARKHTFEEAWGWGVLGWMDPLLEIAFSDPAIDGQMSRELAWQRYVRLQVDLGTVPVALDDSTPEAAQRLEASTALFLEKHEEEMSSIVAELSLPRAPQCGPGYGADYERPVGPRIREDTGKAR